MSLKKVKTIANAFIEPLPKGEDWYEARLKICGGCEYNTANIASDKLSIADKIKKASGLCDNGNHCKACGCCIERKCATKSENCGMIELGETPKWTALDVESFVNKGISIINLSPGISSLKAEKAAFSLTFENVKDNKLDFRFQVHRNYSKLKIKNYRPSCSCISVNSMENVDVNTYEFDVSVSTTGFRDGINERKLFISYFERGSFVSEIMLILNIYKLDVK